MAPARGRQWNRAWPGKGFRHGGQALPSVPLCTPADLFIAILGCRGNRGRKGPMAPRLVKHFPAKGYRLDSSSPICRNWARGGRSRDGERLFPTVRDRGGLRELPGQAAPVGWISVPALPGSSRMADGTEALSLLWLRAQSRRRRESPCAWGFKGCGGSLAGRTGPAHWGSIACWGSGVTRPRGRGCTNSGVRGFDRAGSP